MYDLDDLKITQRTSFPESQVRVISTQNEYGTTAQIPKKKIAGKNGIHLLHEHDHYDLISSMASLHIPKRFLSACGALTNTKNGINLVGHVECLTGLRKSVWPWTFDLAKTVDELFAILNICYPQTSSTQR